MPKVKKIGRMSLEDLSQFVEQKILEILGDPDYGLELKEEFKHEITKRLRQKAKRIPHQKVVREFG